MKVEIDISMGELDRIFVAQLMDVVDNSTTPKATKAAKRLIAYCVVREDIPKRYRLGK